MMNLSAKRARIKKFSSVIAKLLLIRTEERMLRGISN
jgi:hypothetical protein